MNEAKRAYTYRVLLALQPGLATVNTSTGKV